MRTKQQQQHRRRRPSRPIQVASVAHPCGSPPPLAPRSLAVLQVLKSRSEGRQGVPRLLLGLSRPEPGSLEVSPEKAVVALELPHAVLPTTGMWFGWVLGLFVSVVGCVGAVCCSSPPCCLVALSWCPWLCSTRLLLVIDGCHFVACFVIVVVFPRFESPPLYIHSTVQNKIPL